MELCRGASPARATEAGTSRGATLEPSTFDPRPYLDAFPLFASLTRGDREELLARGELTEASRGAGLTGPGRSATPCWIVLYGALEAICPDSRLRMAVLGPGAPIGFLEHLLGEDHLMELRVREPAVLLELSPSACSALMSPTDRLSYRLLHGLCIASIEALERANLVLAREQRMHETAQPGISPPARSA